MTDLTEMWTELEKYQPYADKHGFGETWKRMTTECTEEAAVAAAWDADRWAACLAAVAAAEAPGSGQTTEWARRAIGKIREAIAQEGKT